MIDLIVKRLRLKYSRKQHCGSLFHNVAVLLKKLSKGIFFLDLYHGENEDDSTQWKKHSES